MRRIPPFWVVLIGIAALLGAAQGLAQVRGPDATVTPSTAAVASPQQPTPVPIVAASPDEVAAPTVDPAAVRPCAREDLALLAGGWSGATGSMGGGATVVNVSSDRCKVWGQPSIELLDERGTVIASGTAGSPGEPVQPPLPVVLEPGGVATVITVWRNWCGDPPTRPLALRLWPSPDGPSLGASVHEWANVGPGGAMPRCDVDGAPSTIGALPFEAPEPPEPGSVSSEPCTADDVAAFMGAWGAAAGTSYVSVVVVNIADVACVFDASPAPELRDAVGELLVRGAPLPDAATLDLPAGQAAHAFLGFADWCRPAPRLPFEFDLRVGDRRVRIDPTSEQSNIGMPACQSDPAPGEPVIFFDGPFALPGD